MLRDASHRQVIQKFSFIESLSLSRAKNYYPQSNLDKLNTKQTFSLQQQERSDQSKPLVTRDQNQAPTKATAMVRTADVTATIDANWYQPTTDYSLNLAEIIHATTDKYVDKYVESNLNSSSQGNFFGKILFALSCSYCLFVIWWLFGHQGSNLLATLRGGKNILLTQSDVQFIDYMERSLEQIERKVIAQKKNHDDVVYVPVYTPAPTTSEITTSNIPTNPEPVAPQPLPIPAPPPLPSPTPTTNNSSQNPEQYSASASQAQINHTLIGVLELGGDRSAALIKVQGKTRRVWIGEEIHTDGWILKSVGNQRAEISFQGEVRSISVGETF